MTTGAPNTASVASPWNLLTKPPCRFTVSTMMRKNSLRIDTTSAAGRVEASRKEATAYHLSGTPEPDGYLDLTTLMVPGYFMNEFLGQNSPLFKATGTIGISKVLAMRAPPNL